MGLQQKINNHRLLLFAVLAAIGALVFAAMPALPSAHAAQAPATGKTAAQQFKNIQVLKDIPADQLIPSMQFITAALGVECDFCHVEHEFDKDDKKPKKIARDMMKMMFAINQQNFDSHLVVTCNTCHRGSPHPMAIPAIVAETSTAPMAPSPTAAHNDQEHDMAMEADPAKLPSGAPVFDKYLQAIGGKTALGGVKSRVEQGDAVMANNRKTPIDIYAESPDKRLSVMHMPNGDSVTAYNGQAGWLTFPGRPMRQMSGPDQMAAKLDATAFFPQDLPGLFEDLKLQLNSEKIDGHETSVVLGLSKGEPPVKLYFDKDSGLLVRMVHYAATPLGLNPTQIDFADYRDAGGVKTPYRWTIARPGGAFTIQITKVEQNTTIDASKFVEPPPTPPGPPPGAPGAPPQNAPPH